MRLVLQTFLTLTCICFLTSCSLVPPNKSETIWAKAGTPARIVDDRKAEVTDLDSDPSTLIGEKVLDKKQTNILIDREDNQRVKSKAILQGMMVIDEPTYEYYTTLHKMFGKEYQKKLLEQLK